MVALSIFVNKMVLGGRVENKNVAVSFQLLHHTPIITVCLKSATFCNRTKKNHLFAALSVYVSRRCFIWHKRPRKETINLKSFWNVL